MTNGNKRIQTWINPRTHSELLEFLKDDSNRILGAKVRKGNCVDLGLRLLFKERQHHSLEEIYQDCNNASGDS